MVKYYTDEQEEYFRVVRGTFLTIELVKDQIKLNITMDGVIVDGWKVVPLIVPVVCYYTILQL